MRIAPPILGQAYANLPPGTDSIVLERVARIGQIDGAPEYAFGEIIFIVARDDGSFFACDRNDTSIREYAADGTFRRTVGRKGSGPGEYGSCYNMSITDDSLIVVPDPFNGRFVRFRADGTPMDVVLGGERTNANRADARGRLWWSVYDEGGHEPGVERFKYVLTDAGGREVGEVRVPAPRVKRSARPFVLSTAEGMYSSVPQDSVWEITPDGGRLLLLPFADRVERTGGVWPALNIVRTGERVRYASEERAEWEAWRVFNDRTWQGHAPIPESKPLLRGVRGDHVGRVWIQVHVRAEKRPVPPRPPGSQRPLLTWRERMTFDLFMPDGTLIGRVALPHQTELMATRGDRIWLREEGESGEQLIGIYDLKPARR